MDTPNAAVPSQSLASGVWPPPPLDRALHDREAAEVTVGFRTEFRSVEGSVPNFRQGVIRLSPLGILVDGQSVMPYEYQLPVFIFGLLLPPLWMIAYLVMEYGMRRPEFLSLAWEQVRRIVVAGEEQMVCIIYEAPNFRGNGKVHSLAFPLNEDDYHDFLSCAKFCRPEKVGPGNLRLWTSPFCWAFWAPTLCLGIVSILCMILAGSGILK